MLPVHVDAIFEWEISLLPEELSGIQKEMKSWESPWRKESLEHYGNLGWSFIAINEEKIEGYILGQPLLFFNKWTQSLWVDHLSFKNDHVGLELLDTTIRWAKTKHLQKVLFNKACDKSDFVQREFNQFKSGDFLHLSTTKLNEE